MRSTRSSSTPFPSKPTREELADRSRRLLELPAKLRHVARPIACPDFSFEELTNIVTTLYLSIDEIARSAGIAPQDLRHARRYVYTHPITSELVRAKLQKAVRDAVLFKQRHKRSPV